MTLTFNLPTNVSNGTSPPQGHQLCLIILKSMNKYWSYDPDKSGRTHAPTHTCTHIHLSNIVTAMSRLLQAGSTKTDNIHVNILEPNSKSGFTRIQYMLLAVIISRWKFYQSQHNCNVINYVNYVNFYVDFVASN